MNDTPDTDRESKKVESELRQELVALGEALIARGIEDKDLPEAIVQYSDLFDTWYASTPLGSADSALGSKTAPPAASEARSEIAAVLAIHEAVLELAGKAKDVTETELKGLRSRGKGILAYVDTMPKMVSLTKGRKG